MDVRVVTHSGEDLTIKVDVYNADEYERKLNDNSINMVKIGDIVFARIDVKLVQPIITK
ncbi:hypothetical protein [Bacillus sp. T33-2]|uniref:hypothetical protein n=1 Tax=Bacillus sp. T33-2 TaxID=2054168 RepID=UPI0015E080D8|nr:hypothetical protein [Bacillus sp. T33-2]